MNDILDFLKLLADATRLNIIGLLAQQPRSGDELATILGIKPSTISHHVTRLQEAGLLAVNAQQYYKIYALNTQTLQRYTTLLTPEELAQRVRTEEKVDATAYATQILSRWLKGDRVQGIPRKVQHKRVVFDWIVDQFKQDQRYDDEQVWKLVAQRCHPHYVGEMIRLMVNADYFDRLTDGSWYWRTDSPLVRQADFNPKALPVAQHPDPLEYSLVRAKRRELEPDGDYANLKPRVHVPNLERERKLIVFRFKLNKPYTEEEVDTTIDTYRKDLEGSTAEIRAELLREGLLDQDDDGQYWRKWINEVQYPTD
ncbi:metalloregulator ArsR/SmtB family transcription factor [Chloroflexi bacterium TSY]|nr:metalloregulator ArsR/SmtB family transcription factor [Chloroflexi bacterium TSY]